MTTPMWINPDNDKSSSLPNTIRLWWQLFQIFVYGNAVYAQIWDVLTLKNRIEPPYGYHIVTR